QNEATKHADMFVTFLDANRVLVAQVDARRDPINAAILDRNAQQLQRLQLTGARGKSLQVHRFPVPTREGTYWSPYTNIIMANRLVLMPTFESDDQRIVQNAIATYRRLLPGYEVRTIDMTSMKALQGSLHCLSLNLPAGAPWPRTFYSFQNSLRSLRSATQHSQK
ncbi:MAG: agmatine deiminase, partial [Pirellulaceae bacterium]|nr:agmatine deiminase [Pirellulaceae bacterium]